MIESNLNLDTNLYEALDEADAAFLQRMFNGGLVRYGERLRALGFVNLNTVLDAGCGFGQWSLALAQCNRIVWGVDLDQDRVQSATTIARLNDVRNVCFLQNSLEALDFPDRHFDGIFCYSTLHHTNEEKTLNEFSRLLKPGGLLYINFNALGWYLHLFWHRGVWRRDKHSVVRSIEAIGNFVQGHRFGYHVVTVQSLRQQLSERGFKVLALDGDGCISRTNRVEADLSFYQKRYFGLPGVWEALAEKR